MLMMIAKAMYHNSTQGI